MQRENYLLVQRPGAKGFMENLYFGEGSIRDLHKLNDNVRNGEATEMTVLFLEDGTALLSTMSYSIHDGKAFKKWIQPLEMLVDRTMLPSIESLVDKIKNTLIKQMQARKK